jgi:ornithine carbamoyltransferase
MSGLGSLLALEELSSEQVRAILVRAGQYKCDEPPRPLGTGFLGFISERESVRTRLAVHGAAMLLGIRYEDIDLARSFYADPARRPDHASFVRSELKSLAVLGCRALVVRVHDDDVLRTWRELNALPIINGCSDSEHPLQALADALVLTTRFERPEDINLTLVGNGRLPVFRSLAFLAGHLGISLSLACPEGYGFPEGLLKRAGLDATSVETQDVVAALSRANVVYSDSIVYRRPSMDEARAYEPFRLSQSLVTEYADNAYFMHCLPHSDEIEETLVLGERSLVFEQVAARILVTAATVESV